MTEAERLVLRVLRDPEFKDYLAVGGNQGISNHAMLTDEACQAAVDSLMEKGLVEMRPLKKNKPVMYRAVEEA